jgi:hypothetical protein
MQRYLVPIIPFILNYVIQGIYQISLKSIDLIKSIFGNINDQVRLPTARGLTAFTVIILILWNFSYTFQISILKIKPEMFDYYSNNSIRGYKEMALWTKENTPANSIILTNDIHLYHFWSRRLVNHPPKVEADATDEQVIQILLATKANYITVKEQESRLIPTHMVLKKTIEKAPKKFQLVYRNESNLMYRIYQ